MSCMALSNNQKNELLFVGFNQDYGASRHASVPYVDWNYGPFSMGCELVTPSLFCSTNEGPVLKRLTLANSRQQLMIFISNCTWLLRSLKFQLTLSSL